MSDSDGEHAPRDGKTLARTKSKGKGKHGKGKKEGKGKRGTGEGENAGKGEGVGGAVVVPTNLPAGREGLGDDEDGAASRAQDEAPEEGVGEARER